MNMNSMGGMGGPMGNQPMANHNTPADASGGAHEIRIKLNTYIYDYFVKNELYDLARALNKTVDIETKAKSSPSRKEVNGVNDAMDTDSKDNLQKRPDDLPEANVPNNTESPFLFDWWAQFWDCYHSHRGKGNPTTKQYLTHVQQQARMANERQRMMRADPQMQGNMQFRNAMMQNGMGVPMDPKKMAMQNNRNANPQQIAQMQQYRQAQMQLAQNAQMQRQGSSMEMAGQQRPQSPGSVDNAPSPKRQRIDGNNFNGQMGPMGRGQPPNMQGQQVRADRTDELSKQLEQRGIDPNGLSETQFQALQAQGTIDQQKSMQVYAQSMRQQVQSAMESNLQKGMPDPAGLPQGSPAMMNANGEFFNDQMRGIPGAGPPGANNNSNHALQDYQMQLMLLEQQNKKRLLMARQEQDMTNGPGGPMPGQPAGFAPPMSPQGSRAGSSPNPQDQMKRGTPKMGQGGMPSPTPDGQMPQGRASPMPGFDPSQMNNMPPGMYPNMKMGIMPNGQMMQPPSSHPQQGFNGMTQQQMEMLARQQQMQQQQNGVRMPNGNWPQGQPQMMPGQGQQQVPPNMTPQQRNAAMPPPPAPPSGEAQRTQPSSPQQPPAPPTPSQANKANPKKKPEPKGSANKTQKAPAKKGGATAATPSETDQPPTPTPAPPITPTAAGGFPQKNGASQQPNAQQPQGQNMPQQGQQPDMGVGGPFGNLEGNDFANMSLDFGNIEGPDVLDNFDFDSFLNNDAGDGAFAFDGTMNFTDGGLEAGGDV